MAAKRNVPISDPEPGERGRAGIRMLALAFLIMYMLGFLLPDLCWGTHFLAFLPPLPALLIALLAIYLALLLRPGQFSFIRIPGFLRRVRIRPPLLIVGFAFLCALAYYGLAAQTDIYGDARRNMAQVESALATGNPDWARQMLNPNILDRETGERFMLNLVWLLASRLQISAAAAFGLLNAAFGFLYALAWTSFAHLRIRRPSLKIVATVIGVSAGVVTFFTEHAEIYSAAIVFLLLYLIVTALALSTGRRRWLPPLFVLFLLAAKAHFANNLLIVPLLVTVACTASENCRSRLSRKWLATRVMAPLLIAFAAVYVFVLANHRVSRFVDDSDRHRLIFLSLFDAETNGAPSYTLFSAYHLFDFLNLAILWSAPALLLIAGIWLCFHKRVDLSTPPLLIAELILLLYLGIFFVTNPVLGMPRDWDLFSIPALPLLFYALLLIERVQDQRRAVELLPGPSFALVLLMIPLFVVNGSAKLLTHRLESIGNYTFRSYWKGAGYLINVAMNMSEGGAEKRLERRLKNYQRIKRYALPVDAQFSDLALRISFAYREQKDYDKALPFARAAARASRNHDICLFELGLLHFHRAEYEQSYRLASRAAIEKPANGEYQGLAFNSAYLAGRMKEAVAFGQRYLTLQPDDQSARELLAEIRASPKPLP